MAQITPDPVNPQAQINLDDFHSPSDIENSAALQIVVQDTQNSEAFIQKEIWALRWREAFGLYQAPPTAAVWEGTTVARSNVNRFVVAETVNSIHPQIMNGLFYEDPAFLLRPRPNQTQNTIRAVETILAEQMDEIAIREEIDWGLFSAMLFGTGIWKWGYKNDVKRVKKYKRVGDPVVVKTSNPTADPNEPVQKTEIDTEDSVQYTAEWIEEPIHHPTFEYKDNRYILADPGLRVPDIRRGKFVIDRLYVTYRDLIKLAEEEYVDVDPDTGKQTLKKRYNLPSEATIKSWFEPPAEQAAMPSSTEGITYSASPVLTHAVPRFQKTTVDPLDEPLELLERWDNDKVITVLNRVKVIRNEPNEFGCIPFFSVNWWNIPDAFWGLGLGRVIGSEQRVQTGIINACLDLASLIVNPMYIRARGSNITTQQIRQRIAGILDADVGGPNQPKSTKEAFTIMEQPIIPSEIVNQIGLSQARVERTSGANDQLTMGAAPAGPKSSLGRSGTGAAGIIQATMNRLGGFAEAFVRQVYEPFLYKMHEMNKDKMPISYAKKILGEQLGKDFKFDLDEYMTSTMEFEVLAGSHLAAKNQMGQSLMMIIQLFDNPAIIEQMAQQGKKIDVESILQMVYDISGWKNFYDVVKDMTPDEIQRRDAASQAAQQNNKLQSQMTLNNQKFQQDQATIDQENNARFARDGFKAVTKAMLSEKDNAGAAQTGAAEVASAKPTPPAPNWISQTQPPGLMPSEPNNLVR